MKVIVQIARVLTGLLFIFSGVIKLNDPSGFSIKLNEYFDVFAQDVSVKQDTLKIAFSDGRKELSTASFALYSFDKDRELSISGMACCRRCASAAGAGNASSALCHRRLPAVGEGLQEGQQIVDLGAAQTQRAHAVAVDRLGHLGHRPAALGLGLGLAGEGVGAGRPHVARVVEVQHTAQRAEIAVVHVGPGDRHVAQAGRLELAAGEGPQDHVAQADVDVVATRRIGPAPR